jgi:hypothetical protein
MILGVQFVWCGVGVGRRARGRDEVEGRIWQASMWVRLL